MPSSKRKGPEQKWPRKHGAIPKTQTHHTVDNFISLMRKIKLTGTLVRQVISKGSQYTITKLLKVSSLDKSHS